MMHRWLALNVVVKMEKSEKGLVDMNREEEVKKEICTGIGKKDF